MYSIDMDKQNNTDVKVSTKSRQRTPFPEDPNQLSRMVWTYFNREKHLDYHKTRYRVRKYNDQEALKSFRKKYADKVSIDHGKFTLVF